MDRGLHEKVKILAGVTPMKSVGMARYMKNSVPGMDVPDEIIARLKGAGKGNAAKEGIKICVETIQQLREMKGVAGVHIMAIEVGREGRRDGQGGRSDASAGGRDQRFDISMLRRNDVMAEPVSPDIAVYVCVNCIPEGGHLPHQWTQDGVRALVREVPCSGKMDAQYLLHALEGGARGVCVVACPKGECELAQGNYRAEVRVGTIQRLLTEIGMEPERIELVHRPADASFAQFEQLVHEAVGRICALGESPINQEPVLVTTKESGQGTD